MKFQKPSPLQTSSATEAFMLTTYTSFKKLLTNCTIYESQISTRKKDSDQIFYSNTSSAAFVLLSQRYKDK